MNLPSFENFTMRLFEPWPSAMKISPLGAVTTPAGALKWLSSLPATPGSPSVIRTFPSGLNLRTTCPAFTPAFAAILTASSEAGVGRPHIALAVDVQAVRPDEHLRAEAFDDVALGVELVDRVVRLERAVGVHAVDAEAAAAGKRHRARLVAADEGPDALAVDVDVHRRRRSHLPAARKSCPFAARNARAAAVRQSPDRTVRIAGRPLRVGHRARAQYHHDAANRHPSRLNRLRHFTLPFAAIEFPRSFVWPQFARPRRGSNSRERSATAATARNFPARRRGRDTLPPYFCPHAGEPWRQGRIRGRDFR